MTEWAGHVRVMQLQPWRDRFREVTAVQAGHWPSAASPRDYPVPKQVGLHEQCHDALLDGVGVWGPPSLREEAQSPGHRAGTHCRSGPGLWKAAAASRWQSAWRVSASTAPARRAGQASSTEVCRTRASSWGCLKLLPVFFQQLLLFLSIWRQVNYQYYAQ